MDLYEKSVTILQEQVYQPGKSVTLNDNVLILILSLLQPYIVPMQRQYNNNNTVVKELQNRTAGAQNYIDNLQELQKEFYRVLEVLVLNVSTFFFNTL